MIVVSRMGEGTETRYGVNMERKVDPGQARCASRARRRRLQRRHSSKPKMGLDAVTQRHDFS